MITGSPTHRPLATAVFALAAICRFGGVESQALGSQPHEPTIAEKIAMSTAAVLAVMISEPADGEADGAATFEVVEVLKGADALAGQPGATKPFRFQTKYLGERRAVSYFAFALGKEFQWSCARAVNTRERDYIRGVPKLPQPGAERIVALLPYLESRDSLISSDIDLEVERIPYPELRKAAKQLPVTKVRQWVVDPKLGVRAKTNAISLLSVCGTIEDLPMLRTLNETHPRKNDRVAFALLHCYLALGGEKVLPWFENRYLKDHDREYIEVYSALVALRAASADGGSISKPRSLAAFRLVLERSALADLVVDDLIRLQDWDSAPRMMELFHNAHKSESSEWAKLPVTNFMRASPRADAKKYLAEIEKLDPEVVKKSKAYYPLPGL